MEREGRNEAGDFGGFGVIDSETLFTAYSGGYFMLDSPLNRISAENVIGKGYFKELLS